MTFSSSPYSASPFSTEDAPLGEGIGVGVAGVATATAVGRADTSTEGLAAGTSTATAVLRADAEFAGSSDGIADVSAEGRGDAFTEGTSAGTSTVEAEGGGGGATVGAEADGTSSADAIGASDFTAVGFEDRKALLFDQALAQRVETLALEDLAGPHFTAEVWLNLSAAPTGAGGGYALSCATDVAPNPIHGGWHIKVDKDTQNLRGIAWQFDPDTTKLTPAVPISLDTNYHVVLRLDGINLQLFVDGTLAASVACGNQRDPGYSLKIGALGNAPNLYHWPGIIDDVKVYNRALSDAEIEKRYLGVSISETGLVGEWNLDEGLGTTTVDSSASGNDGTLVNGPTWIDGIAATKVTAFGVGESEFRAEATADGTSAVVATGESFFHTDGATDAPIIDASAVASSEAETAGSSAGTNDSDAVGASESETVGSVEHHVVDSGVAEGGSEDTLTLVDTELTNYLHHSLRLLTGPGSPQERRIIDYSASYVALNATAGSFISTPDSPAISITGDVDLRVKVAADNWTSANLQTLMAARGAAVDSGYSFRIQGVSGRLELYWGSGAAFVVKSSTASPIVANGEALWVRATCDVDNGTGGYDVIFYTSEDGVSWTQLGSTVTTAGSPAVNDPTLPLEIGSISNGSSQILDGKVYYAEMRDGIDGLIVAQFDPLLAAPGDTSFVSRTGETWTITGAAVQLQGPIAKTDRPWRTNQVLWSEDVDNAYWSNTGTIVANNVIGVDGTISGDTIGDDNVAAWELVQRGGLPRVAAGSPVFAAAHIVKDAITPDVRYGLIRVVFGGLSGQYVDLRFRTDEAGVTAVPQGVGSTIIGFGVTDEGNHWRVWVSATNSDPAWSSCTLQIYPAVGASISLSGYNSAITGSLGISGIQYGQGAVPTDYIQTQGATVEIPADGTTYEIAEAITVAGITGTENSAVGSIIAPTVTVAATGESDHSTEGSIATGIGVATAVGESEHETTGAGSAGVASVVAVGGSIYRTVGSNADGTSTSSATASSEAQSVGTSNDSSSTMIGEGSPLNAGNATASGSSVAVAFFVISGSAAGSSATRGVAIFNETPIFIPTERARTVNKKILKKVPPTVTEEFW